MARYFLLGAFSVTTKKELALKQKREEEARIEAHGTDTPRGEEPAEPAPAEPAPGVLEVDTSEGQPMEQSELAARVAKLFKVTN